jgi:phosphatidylserine/phosphatidylglycerophosphate/cardiolipin synthase-like enzyme
MRQSGSSPQQQAYTGVIVLLLASFAGGYFVGTHGGASALTGAAVSPANDGELACWFSPQGGCTDAVVAEISRATKTVQVLCYTFTSHPIADALIEAHQRGVAVTVVADKSEVKDTHSEIQAVARAGIPVYIDSTYAIAHNKIMVIDGNTVITGSFNFTHAAEYDNADNVLVIHNHPTIAAAYVANFEQKLGHSAPFTAQ